MDLPKPDITYNLQKVYFTSHPCIYLGSNMLEVEVWNVQEK